MMLRGLCVGGLVGGACAVVAALAGGAVATCGALVCAGSALGMIGAEGLRVRHSQDGASNLENLRMNFVQGCFGHGCNLHSDARVRCLICIDSHRYWV